MDDKLFDLMTKMYNKMQEMKQEISDTKINMATKQDIVELENKISDKLDALLDVMERQVDSKTELAIALKDVKCILEKIELDIIRNR